MTVAFIGAIYPFKMFSRGTTPDFQAYQDAKGSWVPYGLANSMAGQILLVAAFVGVLGFLLVSLSHRDERRRIHRVLEQRTLTK